MTDQEKILSFVKRIHRLEAYFENGMVYAKSDYGTEDNEIADTYEECLEDLRSMFPDVLKYGSKYYNIHCDVPESKLIIKD